MAFLNVEMRFGSNKVRDESFDDDCCVQMVFVIESAGVEGESAPEEEKSLRNPLPFSKFFFRFVLGVVEDACKCARSGVESSSQTILEPLLKDNPQKCGNIKAVSTYATTNLLSRLSFSWMSPLLAVGYKSPLHIDDVPQVAEAERTGQLYPKFRAQLEAKGDTGLLAKALLISFRKEVLLTAFLAALETCAPYVGPCFINAFVQFLGGKKQFESQGYVLVCAFFLAKVLESLSQRQGFFKQHQLTLRVRAALTAIIYRKGLLLSSQSRQKHTSG